jgi:hypothetical protein
VEKTVKKFRSFAEAEKADRDFYKNSPATSVCGFWWSSLTSVPENARLLVDTLNEFGFVQSGFKESNFRKPEELIPLGRAPTRINLLTSISGVSSDEASANKVWAKLDGIPVFVLGKDALVRNKRAVGRPQDLADIDTLEN